MSHQPNNVFAGTQVVCLVEVRGPVNPLVHPRGAVGVVTRAPAVDGERYRVRFPDGFESSFPPGQLEVLKHFKDRLGSGAGVPPAGSGSVPAPRSSATGSKQGCFADPQAGSLLRLLLTGAATLREGRVPVRVEAHRDRLLTVKRGELPWADCPSPIGWERVPKAGEGNGIRWRTEHHRDFEHALAETKLPERPDYEAANRFLVKARREMTIGASPCC